MTQRLMILAGLIVVSECGTATSATEETPTTVVASTSTTSTTTSTTSTTTTTVTPIQISGVFTDVAQAAALGPLPENFALGAAAASKSPLYDNSCHASTAAISPVICEFGALEVAAQTNHWQLVSTTKSSCPVADVPTYRRRDALPDGEELLYPECDEFHKRAHAAIREMQPDLVIFPVLSRFHLVNNGGIAAFSVGLGKSISAVAGSGIKVLVLGKTPKTNGEDIPSCLARYKTDISRCANPRTRAEFPERIQFISDEAAQHSATYVNPVDWFCTVDVCPGQIGGQIVYRDYNHISDQFARYRAPQIAEAIKLALVGPDAT
jgi:hypothetical protein